MGKGRKCREGGGPKAKKHCAQEDQGNEVAIEPSLLMSLPVELILYILSFLTTADRLMARVNRALYKLEEGEQYYVDHMVIASKDNEFLGDAPLRMALDGPRSRYIEGLRKLATNVFVGWLSFEFCEPANRELIPYVKAFRSEALLVFFDIVRLDDEETPEEELNDDSLNGWIGNRKCLNLFGDSPVTGERLYDLFSDMESGRSSLVKCLFDGPKQAESNKLLQFIGISYRNGRFHSGRHDVEVYVLRETADEEDDYDCVNDTVTPDRHFFILMGRMMVAVRKWTLTVTEVVDSFEQIQLAMERHNEDGSLPEGRTDLEFMFESIADIRNDTARFKQLPVVYS